VSYRIHVSEAVVKELNRLPKPTRVRLWHKIRALPRAPRGAGTKALQGALRHMRSLRVSDYRAIYVVDDDDHVLPPFCGPFGRLGFPG
jgi:mRNA-degrading endonuclease RelE of RelBE toxin-antitoxin system